MSEDRAQALLSPQSGIAFSQPSFGSPVAVDYNQYSGSHVPPVGSIDLPAANRFTLSSSNGSMLDSQDCEYQIINYEELEKLLPEPKPHGRAELGVLPDGSAYAPKTATRDNFLLFPSKLSYILYFTHHYFSKENLVRDHTFVSMLVNRLVMPLDKLIRAPRLAALQTTTEDVEHALVKSKVVCIEDMGSGIRGVRRIDGYPAFLSADDNIGGSIQQDVPSETVTSVVPNLFHKCNVTSFSPCNTEEGDVCSGLLVSPNEFHQITSAQLPISSTHIPGNNVGVATSLTTLATFNACASTTATGHLIRIPSSQLGYSSLCGTNNISPLSPSSSIAPSENQVIVTTTMPNSNALNSLSNRPCATGGGWSCHQPSLLVVGRRNGVPVAPAGSIGSIADASNSQVYGQSQHQPGSSLLGMRSRPPYSPSLPYSNSALPNQDLLTAGLSLRPPAASHLQQYIFNQPNAVNAYANCFPAYHAGNPINVAMANALIGQSTGQHQRQQPAQTALSSQFITNPFFAGNPSHFTVTAAALNAAHQANFNPYQMALAAMAAAANSQSHHLGGQANTAQYFHSPLGLSPYQPSASLFYANPAHVALHLGRHPRVPPPSQCTGSPYPVPALCQLPQMAVNPISPSIDLYGPQFSNRSNSPDISSYCNYNTGATPCNSSSLGGGGSGQTTSVANSSPIQRPQLSSPGPLLLQSSGPVSQLQSASSNPNITASSLVAAAANLHIQYPPPRPLSTATGDSGGNAFVATPFTVDASANLAPTTCTSPSHTLASSSSGIGSKSDTPNTDVKADEADTEKNTQRTMVDCTADTILHRHPLGMSSDETCVFAAQLQSRNKLSDTGEALSSVNRGEIDGSLSNSTEDSTDDSASSGICEMNSVDSQCSSLQHIDPSTSYRDSQTVQPCRLIGKKPYSFSSYRRMRPQQPGIKDSVYKT